MKSCYSWLFMMALTALHSPFKSRSNLPIKESSTAILWQGHLTVMSLKTKYVFLLLVSPVIALWLHGNRLSDRREGGGSSGWVTNLSLADISQCPHNDRQTQDILPWTYYKSWPGPLPCLELIIKGSWSIIWLSDEQIYGFSEIVWLISHMAVLKRSAINFS